MPSKPYLSLLFTVSSGMAYEMRSHAEAAPGEAVE